MWCPLECTGSIPPPSAASITMTDDHHAVLYRADSVPRNHRRAYLLDLKKMVLLKILTVVSTFERLFFNELQPDAHLMSYSQMRNHNIRHVLCKH